MSRLWSVLLPTHNSADTLAAAIASVLAQTESDLELIIVGDGCGDDTRLVVAAAKDPRIVFVDAPKGAGFGYETRRTALKSASGRFVAFVADDDIIGPHHLAALGAELEQSDIAYSRPIWCVPTGELVPLSVDLREATMRAEFETKNYVPAVFWAMRRSTFDAAGGWPTHVAAGADWYLWRAALALPDVRVGYLPVPSALHFRARRRDADHEVVEAILALEDRASWWPQDAVLPAADVLQLHTRLLDPDWWARLSTAVTTIEHHLAFALIDEVLHGVDWHAEILRVKLEVHAFYNQTLSWKLTAPLRAVRGRWSLRRR